MRNKENLVKSLLKYTQSEMSLNILCQLHDQYELPYLLGLEECTTCKTNLCYICSNKHIDNQCKIKCMLLLRE